MRLTYPSDYVWFNDDKILGVNLIGLSASDA